MLGCLFPLLSFLLGKEARNTKIREKRMISITSISNIKKLILSSAVLLLLLTVFKSHLTSTSKVFKVHDFSLNVLLRNHRIEIESFVFVVSKFHFSHLLGYIFEEIF